MSIHFPTEQEVLSLKVGDQAPDYGGSNAKVVEISGRGYDTRGDAFVCYWTQTGASPTSRTTMSFKANRVTHASAWNMTSDAHDDLEAKMRAERGLTPAR